MIHDISWIFCFEVQLTNETDQCQGSELANTIVNVR